MAESRLHIAWPEYWEIRPPVTQGSALRLQARQLKEGATLQLLDITAVNTREASRPVDVGSIRILAERLRDATLPTAVESSIELTPFGSASGFYFVATDRNYRAGAVDDYRQLIEGVMLRSEYLINFTLLTNDASAAESREILQLLDELTID
jgi:hypothetical protein